MSTVRGVLCVLSATLMPEQLSISCPKPDLDELHCDPCCFWASSGLCSLYSYTEIGDARDT